MLLSGFFRLLPSACKFLMVLWFNSCLLVRCRLLERIMLKSWNAHSKVYVRQLTVRVNDWTLQTLQIQCSLLQQPHDHLSVSLALQARKLQLMWFGFSIETVQRHRGSLSEDAPMEYSKISTQLSNRLYGVELTNSQDLDQTYYSADIFALSYAFTQTNFAVSSLVPYLGDLPLRRGVIMQTSHIEPWFPCMQGCWTEGEPNPRNAAQTVILENGVGRKTILDANCLLRERRWVLNNFLVEFVHHMKLDTCE